MKVGVFFLFLALILFLSLSGQVECAAAPHGLGGGFQKRWKWVSPKEAWSYVKNIPGKIAEKITSKIGAQPVYPTGEAPEQGDIPSLAHIAERPVPVGFPLGRGSDGRISSFLAAPFVALGDSYSCGIGTDDGHVAEDRCRQGVGGYPNLIAEDLTELTRLGDSSISEYDSASASDDVINGAISSGFGPLRALRTRRGSAELCPNDNSSSPHLARRGTTAPNVMAWLSCSGATTEDMMTMPQSRAWKKGLQYDPGFPGPFQSAPDMMARQLDALADIMTPETPFGLLSIGGNDLGFTEIITACLFRFKLFVSGDCEKIIRENIERIREGTFGKRMEDVMDNILDIAEVRGNGEFKLTVTGYARFFNDLTDECNDVTFAFIGPNRPRVTRQLRRRLNRLVELINSEIGEAVERVQARRFGTAAEETRVVFVNPDAKFEGHRFCEPGVVNEPDRGRADTWFFAPLGWDHEVDADGTGYVHLLELEKVKDQDPETCFWGNLGRRDWGGLAQCVLRLWLGRHPEFAPPGWEEDFRTDGVVGPSEADIEAAAELFRSGKCGEQVGRLLVKRDSIAFYPTVLAKVFHPKRAGHRAIRDATYQRWAEVRWS